MENLSFDFERIKMLYPLRENAELVIHDDNNTKPIYELASPLIRPGDITYNDISAF
jgi:hypothetical protein